MAAAEEEPQSVEEAGALLGAAITRYGSAGSYSTLQPPKGTHSSFSTMHPVPSSELFVRLHSLRSLLRSAPQDTPLVAAPSLLAGVLMKLLGISNMLASNVDPTRRTATPPMLSTPLRQLWVDCVILCHSLGEGLSGNARINIFGFCRNMIQLAYMNPRTARAAGGTRIAALEVLAGIMKDPKLAKSLASWALDVIALSQRALKSSGNGEPTYRMAAVQCACSTAIASRIAFLKTRPVEGSASLVLKGALEDKAILEIVKLLKIATTDKFPEVRGGAARLASLLAPMVIHTQIKSPRSPDAVAISLTAGLEDIMTIAFKNLDDESPDVASGWAEALARCMSTSMEFHSQLQAEKTNQRSVDGDGNFSTSDKMGARSARKGVLSAAVCATLPKALKYLVSMFVKVGGELVAPRAGGSCSTGGRAVRIGLTRTIVHLLRLQSSLNAVGEGKSISNKEAILTILSMVGSDLEAQLHANDRLAPVANLDATSVVTASTVRGSGNAVNTVFGQAANNPLFGQGPKVSHADAGLARLAASRALREGISDLSTESTQISILHELISLVDKKRDSLKGNQLQVVLIEISHLFATLGEATASAVDDLKEPLMICLRHPDHGVRHEAAVAVVAVTAVFPVVGRQLVQDSINSMQLEHAELLALASTKTVEDIAEPSPGPAGRFARFRRAAPVKEVKTDKSLKHQYAIHGMALMVSMIVRDLPNLQGGLPVDLFDNIMSVSEILSSTLFNEVIITGNPSGACTCVRAGFGIICGALATGPSASTKHIALIFGLWQKVTKDGQRGKRFTADHELICVEAMLSSVVAFLKNCSELLLSVPDALSRTSLLLEQLLPLFFVDGRLGTTPVNPAAASRLDSAQASILEAFSWLPPGSYPMIADSVFAFAASRIQNAIQDDVTCSILRSLVSNEDVGLDAMTFSRATQPGQVCGARDLENDIIALTSEAAHHGDRESAMYFFGLKRKRSTDVEFRGSQVLGMIASDDDTEKPPTALHEVGTWRRPASPSCCAKVRLIDAAIQAYAATFSLKSGKEQQNALQMLESLVPPAYFQLSRAMGVSTALAEQDRRAKSKEDNASVANISAVLLSCLRALPINESTHNIPIGLGPSWMKKAKDILIAILPARSHVVRRAAAEGLALLGTLGVKEDAHFMQSAVLHSLDEVMQGNPTQGQGRVMPIESVSAARAGALLTLGCMQRTAYRIKKQRNARSRIRGSPAEQKEERNEDIIPTVQMMIRVLPSISIHATGGLFSVRTYGLHAFGLLFAYSEKLQNDELNAQDRHLLRKTVELVEDNFLAAWTVASYDHDHGTEAEKLSSEASFAAVILRLMTFLLPHLHHLESFDASIATRFSRMATILMERCGSHPAVQMEAMAFYELLSLHQHLLPRHAGGVKYDEHSILCCIPFLMATIAPNRSPIHPAAGWISGGRISSEMCLRAALKVINMFSLSRILVVEWSDMRVVSLLYAALEDTIGSRSFAGETFHRSLAAPREAEIVFDVGEPTEEEICKVVRSLLYLERTISRNSTPVLLRYILLSRSLIVGTSGTSEETEDDVDPVFSVARVIQSALNRAVSDASPIYEHANPVRWQVKTLAVQVATVALNEIAEKCQQDGSSLVSSSIFNPQTAKTECSIECQEANSKRSSIPQSKLALHIGAILTAACAAATATVDQAELRSLQECAMYMITQVIECFGSIPDPGQPATKVLTDYIPQISSSIKSALVAPNDEEGETACRLFLAGCETLKVFVHTKVSEEKGVLKRLIRPALPTSEEAPFFGFDAGAPSNLVNADESKRSINRRATLLIRIGKLWTLGNIPLNDPDIMPMIQADKANLGIHSAALAIDGARLLLGSGLSPCGRSIETRNAKVDSGSGFFYDHIADIDDSVKAALVKTWASCASMAVALLSEAIATAKASSSRRDEYELWLRRVMPFLFAGLDDSTKFRPGSSSHNVVGWARGVDEKEVAGKCLQGIIAMLAKPGLLELEKEWKQKIEYSIVQTCNSVLMPILSPDPNSNTRKTSSPEGETEFVSTSCLLLHSLASHPSFCVDEGSSLLLCLLRPLDLLQNSAIDLNDKHAALIVSACLTSVAGIVSKPTTPDTLVKAMVSLVLKFSVRKNELPGSVKTSIRILLKECMSHESVTAREQDSVAVVLAKSREWDTWSVVVRVNDGVAAKGSFAVVQGLLLDCSIPEQQLALVAALRGLLQSAPPPNAFVGRTVCAVGTEILALFQAYGTLNVPKQAQLHRIAMCADCMQIALATLQQLAYDTTEQEMAQFLVLLFQRFIAVLRFNGLPNHPPPQPGSSDPTLGRMCAQAITHVARTAPVPFKSSMAGMAEHDRAVLEFAVRADVSGYATAAAQAPTKKKLSLKGFKK